MAKKTPQTLGEGRHLVMTELPDGRVKVRVFEGEKPVWAMDPIQDHVVGATRLVEPILDRLGFQKPTAPSPAAVERVKATEAMVAEALASMPDKSGFDTGDVYARLASMYPVDETKARRLVQSVLSRLNRTGVPWIGVKGKRGKNMTFHLDSKTTLQAIQDGLRASNRRAKVGAS